MLSLPSPPSPILFEAGPIALRYYGLFIALAIVVGTWLASRELDRKGYDPTAALDSLFFVIPPGFVGARLYHVITDWGLYSDNFTGVFEVWNGGLGIYGAVAGGFLGALAFCWWRQISVLEFADAAAPGLIIGQAIGRWGNYFNQELFGRPTNLPWGIRIAEENRPFGFEEVEVFHPTFLYESLWNLAVGLVLLWIARRFAGWLMAGDLFLIYVSLYSVGRFFVEALRIDPAFIIGTFRGNLFVAAILALTFGLILLLRHAQSSSKNRRRPRSGGGSG